MKFAISTRFQTVASLLLTILSISMLTASAQKPVKPIANVLDYSNIISLHPEQQLELLSNYLLPLHQQIYYRSTENFTAQVLYSEDYELFLSKAAALQLALVQDSLQRRGLDILLFDGYRPHAVTRKMWEIVPDERYAANPVKGSGHNRGIAVDLTLINANTGEPVEMPSGYDNFTEMAHHDFMGASVIARQNRSLLKSVMEYFGFVALSTEWWHYSLEKGDTFPVYDISFTDLRQLNSR